jgi:O-antigen ligase
MVWAAAVWLGSVLALWAYGLARGGDFRNSLWQCHQLLWLPLAYLVFRSALRGRQDHGALMRVVVGAACLKAGLALWIRLTVSHSLQALPTATSHGDSVLFACAFALVVALVVEDAVPGRGLAAGLVLVLLAAGMVANNRRLAWVEVAAALAVVAAVASATRLKRAALRAGVLSLPVLLLYCAVGWTSAFVGFKPVRLLRSLAESGTDVSTAMRDIENFNLLWTLRDHPLLGTGFGHEYVEKVKGMDISGIFAQYRFVPHNGILGLLAFGGVLGISGILLTPVVAVYLAARAHRFARSPADRAAALAVMASAVVYLIQCYGDMGFVSWTGVFTLAPAVAVAGKLASATGAWPGSDVPDLGAGGVAAGS